MKSLATCLALTVCALSLQAESAPEPKKERPVSLLLGLGFTGGGDKLATAEFADGSTKSLNSGALVYLKGGIDWKINPKFSAQATFGYHGDNVTASNGDMRFERSFVEGLGHYALAAKHRVGLGLRKSMGAKYKASGLAASGGPSEIKFAADPGLVFEYEFFSKNGPTGCGLNLRYVIDKYKPNQVNGIPATGREVNGSHIGFGFNLFL